MTTKIIVITGISIAAVVGMYILGRRADKGGTDAKGDKILHRGNDAA